MNKRIFSVISNQDQKKTFLLLCMLYITAAVIVSSVVDAVVLNQWGQTKGYILVFISSPLSTQH